MNKRILLVSVGLVTAMAGAILVATAATQKGDRQYKIEATDPTYSFTLDDEIGVAAGSGTFTKATSLQNDIEFTYSGASTSDGNLMELAVDGELFNTRKDTGYHNRISGIKNIEMTYNGKLGIDYTWGESLDAETPYYQRRNYVLASDGSAVKTFVFFDEQPNYFRLKAIEATTITSITVNYSCPASVDEVGTENLALKNGTDLQRFADLTNAGQDYEGQVVELANDINLTKAMSALPCGANTYFKGTFDGKGHTISNYGRTLTGDKHANNFGFICKVEGGTIKNLTLENLALNSNDSINVGGITGIANNAVIENVHITGTSVINGKQYVGGIVGKAAGVIVNNATTGENLTITTTSDNTGGIVGGITAHGSAISIKNCINKANISETSSSSYSLTGGIIGSTNGTHTSDLIIDNCINYGNITGNKTYVGGIIGLARKIDATNHTAQHRVTNCANFGTITGSASVGSIVGVARNGVYTNCHFDESLPNQTYGATESANEDSENRPTMTGCNAFIEVSNQSEFETNVIEDANVGILLTENITFSPAFSSSISSFSGIIMGNNHYLSGLSTGLFTLGTNAYVSDLTIKNATVTGSVEGVGILFGKFSGVGGARNVTIDSTCSVTNDKSGGNGSIVGYVHVANARFSVINVINNAAITGLSNGTAGIVGEIQSNIEFVAYNCENHGAISGTQYVGGIIGIARQDTASIRPVIAFCKNYGNISATKASGGGIVGLTRINVEYCGCLSTVTIKGSTASTLNAVGEVINGDAGGTTANGKGYIAGSRKNSKTVIGSYLFN